MEIQLAILGGGLVGRIAGAVLGGVILEAGDKPIHNMERGVFYLHITEGMRLVLKKLDLPTDTTFVKAGIIWWKQPISFESMSHEEAKSPIEAYCMKTRGVPLISLPDDEQLSIMDYAAFRWVGGKRLRFTTSVSDLWRALVSCTHRQTIYSARVKSIESGQILTTDGSFLFNTAINTLPLNLLAGYASGLEFKQSITFRFRVYEILFKGYDYLYLPSTDYRATRISFPYKLGMSIDRAEVWLETSGSLEEAYRDMENLGYRVPVYVGMISNKLKQLEGNPEPYVNRLREDNVYSLGRYANWDNSLTASDAAWEVILLGGHKPNVQETTDK